MKNLYPIVRRVRRPLLPAEKPVQVNAEMLKAEKLKSPEPEKTETSDASDASNADAE